MGEYPPNQNHADWRARGDVEAKFEILPPPEIKESWRENKRQTENGQPLRHEILDEEGRQFFVHEISYQTGPEPSPETKKATGKDLPTSMMTRIASSGNAFKKIFPEGIQNFTSLEHQYDDKTGAHTTTGYIEAGQDTSHSWKTTRGIVKDFGDGRIIKLETTEVLEQGQNPSKPEPGAKFTKVMYFEGGSWKGEEVEHLDGRKTQQLAGSVETLPDWQ